MRPKKLKIENLKVVLAGGGTGGHIYPAIAVAQELKLDADVEKIYYLGNPKNMEYEIAQKEGLEFLPVTISGMPRHLGIALIKWFFELFRAVNTAIRYFIRIKPSVVLGTGGYVSAPALLAAIILRIPFAIHEPDAHPGIVSKFMSPWATVVSVAFVQAGRYLTAKNLIVNGNPVRDALGKASKQDACEKLGLNPDKKTLLVMGGSQGAKKINEAMADSAKIMAEELGIQVIHQTGRKNYDEYLALLTDKYPDYAANTAYVVRPYFDDMTVPLSIADLAVSRAGSLSISELNISKLPSILVPYPYAAQDHQRYNARAMENQGASVYLEDGDCNSTRLVELVKNILSDENKLGLMREQNASLAKPNAAKDLVEVLKNVAK